MRYRTVQNTGRKNVILVLLPGDTLCSNTGPVRVIDKKKNDSERFYEKRSNKYLLTFLITHENVKFFKKNFEEFCRIFMTCLVVFQRFVSYLDRITRVSRAALAAGVTGITTSRLNDRFRPFRPSCWVTTICRCC